MQKKKFAVFDIDGTLIRWQLYHAIADELGKRELIDAETLAVIHNARMQWKRREYNQAFKDYELHLVDAYEKVLLEISPKQFEAAANETFETYKDQAYTYTRQLIKDLKARGYHLFAVSGSPGEVITKIAAYYGFDDFIGALFVRNKGRFTGEKISPVFDKKAALDSLIQKHGLSYSGSIGIGDSHSDIGLLSQVEQPIAFNPEDRLFEHAKQQGWKIVVERKNVVYELMKDGVGYKLII